MRIALRLPIAIIIVLLSLAELNTTLLMGLVTMLLDLVNFESVVGTPRSCLFDSTRPKKDTNTNTNTNTNNDANNNTNVNSD